MATNDTPGGDGWQWPPSGPRHDSGAGLFAHLPARLPPPGRRARPCAAPAGSAAVARWPGGHVAATPADTALRAPPISKTLPADSARLISAWPVRAGARRSTRSLRS